MTTPAAYDAVLTDCYQKFYAQVFAVDICPKKLVLLAVRAMEVVESTPLEGSIQKSMVIKMLQKFVSNAPIVDSAKKYYLKLIENGMIGAVIEAVIAASKNKVGVNSPVVVKKSGCF